MSFLETLIEFIFFSIAAIIGLILVIVIVIIIVGTPVLIYEAFENRLRRKRYLNNQCIRCGYSLEGLAGIIRCPECGYH